MNRRNVLRYTAYTVTGAAVYPLIQGCQSSTAAEGFKPVFFDDAQYSLIGDICDVLLPETDTPGAVSLGVPAFFDGMVGTVFPKGARENFGKDFNKLSSFLDQESKGGNFAKSSSEDKATLITRLDKQWHEDDSDSDEKAAYLGVRSQIISYYLSTEYVGTNETKYLPVPGPYQGCIDASVTEGKAWTI